jgi:hypothetical protein
MYRYVQESCSHSYLHPNDLPNEFYLQDHLTRTSINNVYSGDMIDSFIDDGPFLSLASA